MEQSPENKRKLLLYVCDILFVLWLTSEVLLGHGILAQGALGLLALCGLACILLEKKVYVSYWIPLGLVVLLWGLIGALGWSLNRSASLSVVKTLCVNLAFFFCLFQYLMARRNMDRVLTLYMAAVAAIALYLLWRCLPMDILNENARLGILGEGNDTFVLVNPNWSGLMAAFSFAIAMERFLGVFSGEKKAGWWAAPMVFFGIVVLLTKSTKAYGVVFLAFTALILMRWPKKWGWKLLGIVGAALFLFYVVIARMDVLDHVFFHKLRYTIENIFHPGENDVSLDTRGSLFAIGWQAFLSRPFTGWGLGCYQYLPGAPESYSHINYLEMLVVGGVPMLIFYYAPFVLAVKGGFARARESRTVRLLLLITLLYLLMDFGQVTYVDRSMLLVPLLLTAATRLVENRPGDGDWTKGWAFVKNPYKIIQRLSTTGKLDWMPDKLYLKLLYRGCLGKKLRLNPPVTMNEKLQWMKLYDRNPLYPKLVDKAAVRDYVAERGYGDALIPLLGVWDSPEDIDFSALPERFVLKCSHDSGGVRICRDKAAFDTASARAWLTERLKKNYFSAGREWPYKCVKPRVLAEAYLGNGDAPPDDMKFFCFDGQVKAILVCTNRRAKGADYYFFHRDFTPFPINEQTKNAPADFRYEKPACLDEMLALAEGLSKGLRQVRVDLYAVEGKVYFGEMTLFDQSGFAGDYVDDGDRIMGDFFSIGEES